MSNKFLSIVRVGSLGCGAALLATAAMAQEAGAVKEVEKARLRVTCIQPDGAAEVRGRLTNFYWTRNGNPIKIVGGLPLTCARDDSAVRNENGIVRSTSGRTINVPARATDLHYRMVAHEVNAEGKRLPRTVCEGDVNFRNSLGDLDTSDPMRGRGDLPKYTVYCHLGGGSRVAFRIRPFTKEVPVPREDAVVGDN